MLVMKDYRFKMAAMPVILPKTGQGMQYKKIIIDFRGVGRFVSLRNDSRKAEHSPPGDGGVGKVF